MSEFNPADNERFVVQPGEFVALEQTRAYGDVAEIIADYDNLTSLEITARESWLRELWEWAQAIDMPLSSLLVESFFTRGIITELEHDSYEIKKLLVRTFDNPDAHI